MATGNVRSMNQDISGQRLTEFCQENRMVIANTTMQEMMQKMNLPTTQEIILHIDITR